MGPGSNVTEKTVSLAFKRITIISMYRCQLFRSNIGGKCYVFAFVFVFLGCLSKPVFETAPNVITSTCKSDIPRAECLCASD